ncbi:hypothetical protein ACLBWS_15410 [Brucellaceae bacterium D45D]
MFAQALQLMEALGIDWIYAQIAQRHDFLEQMADRPGLVFSLAGTASIVPVLRSLKHLVLRRFRIWSMRSSW